MSASARQDVIGFTRIFVLFCTLVLLPALLLSSFGVIAIMNEREAEKQRRREEALNVLQRAEQRFAEALDASDRALKVALENNGKSADEIVQITRALGHPVGPWILVPSDGGALEGAALFTTPDTLGERVSSLARSVEPGRPAHAFVDEGSFSGVVSVQRLADGRALLYALDPVRIDAALTELAKKDARRDGMVTTMRVAEGGGEPVVNAVDRFLQEIESAREKAKALEDNALEELAERTLEAPFDRFTLTVHAPPSATSTRTIIAYIVLMAVFLGTLITGVVLVARLIWQETRLSRLKTDFVSHMSHELRTPLTSIRMFIETLRLGRATSEQEQQECLDLLSKETERLSEMIERVLGYARLRAGRRLFNPRPVEAAKIIEDTLDAFRAQNLDTKDLELKTEIAPELPMVRADRDALVEAMLNLVGNAYKYSGPHKEITVFARPGRAARVVLGVRDNGPGLPKGEHTRVFERFYQAGGLLSSKKSGSGLGLAITKAIVDGNGGRISVESEPGKGSTFQIEMRAAQERAR
jgi:two-component system, OmpR family, phosphate regulon sensor histidine kinase PhoR